MFIEQLRVTSDLAKVNEESDSIIANVGWKNLNQIGLKHRPCAANIWTDAAGSLYNRQTNIQLAKEIDFSEWSVDTNSYIRQQIESIEEEYNFKCGRVRIMRLLPHQGLSVHKDLEVRFHLVLKTNPKSYIAHRVIENNSERSQLPTAAICYHLPMDGKWYQIDTREVHWVYNGGESERIHLVVCGT